MQRHLNCLKICQSLICIALLLLPFSVQAEIKRLLIIDSENASPYQEARESMLQAFEKKGYRLGDNLEVSQYSIDNVLGTGIRVLRAEAHNHDVIFTNGTIASKAAYQFGYLNYEHKFVFCSVTDPVGLGLISTINQPGSSNFTGVAYGIPVYERLQFLRKILPNARTLGMIHSDLPQSVSYINWLKQHLNSSEFSDLKLIAVELPFVRGEYGSKRMARQMEKYIKELSPVVDVFLTPSDQFGTKPVYTKTISRLSDKPVMALSEQELRLGWGSHFGAYPNQESAGRIAAHMVIDLFNGSPIEKIKPVYSDVMYGIHKPYTDGLESPLPNSLWLNNQIKIFHLQQSVSTSPASAQQ